MKILVPIKRVIDAYVTVRVKADGSGVETANVKMSINPFCEIAVEEALRLREGGKATEIVVVSAGPAAVQETLRDALNMGADRALHVQTDAELQPLAIAKLLKAIAEREQPGLILTGKQGIDGDNNQTGQMLAGLLGWAQATFASKIEINGERVTVVREIDGGHETLDIALPAVVTTDLRLNTPRFRTLPNIMKAKKKTIEMLDAATLGVDLAPRFTTVKTAEPPKRRAGVMLKTVDELVDKLKNEAKVI